MTFLGAWRLLGAVAIAGLVAGCAGNSLNSTPGVGGTSQAPMSHVKNPKGLLVAPGRAGQLVAQGVHTTLHQVFPAKKSKGGCIYLSLNGAATVNIYNAGTLAQTGAIDAGTSGWGVGDNKKYAFVGTNNSTDDLLVHKQCDTSGNVVKTYVGSGLGNPYGVWVGEDNSAMSTQWPSNSIDEWDGTGTLLGTSVESNMGEAYFLWYDPLDKKSAKKGEHERILVNGWNTAFTHSQADTCTRVLPNPALTCTTMIANSGGFPGGIIAHHDASSKYQGSNVQNVVVDDQYGILNGFACDITNATCTPNGSFTYSNGGSVLDYTAIVFGGKCKDIWAANIGFNSQGTNLQSDAQQNLPDTVGGGSSLGVNTAPVNGDQTLGVAYSKPCKDT